MDTAQPSDRFFNKAPNTVGVATSVNSSNFLSDNRNIVIGILVGLLILSFLGINLASIVGNVVDMINQIFGPFVSQILSVFGYTAGTILNKTSDVVTDTAKTGLDIADGTIHSIGDLLKNASSGNIVSSAKHSLDNALNQTNKKHMPPNADKSESSIQQPISTGKAGWCLVGDFQGRRGCVEVNQQDQCLSGQVFPTQKLCLNPTMTQNYEPIPPIPFM